MLNLLYSVLAIYYPPGSHYSCQQYVRPMPLSRSDALLWSRDALVRRCGIPAWLTRIIGSATPVEIRNSAHLQVARRLFSPRRANRPPRTENYGTLRPVDAPPVLYKGQEIAREEPDIIDCDSPRAGWLGVVSTSITRRRVQFDGSPPFGRTGQAGTVPDIGEALTFSPEQPATIFNQATPCYFQAMQQCSVISAAGTFVVAGRIWYNAGPGGAVRWQLCLIREEEVTL
jgi:hypothetical protein